MPSPTFVIFIFICLYATSVSEECLPVNEFRTKSVAITEPLNARSEAFPLYAAVNGTIQPSEPSVSQIFRFVPASYWINNTLESCNTQLLNFTRSNPLIRLTEDFLKLSAEEQKTFPDRSLWSDRSVLILTIHRLSFKKYGDVCPSVIICPIPGLPSLEFLKTVEVPSQICKIPTTTGCHEKIDFAFHLLYPLATGARIAVQNLGKNLTLYRNDLQFVLTSAYRLDMGEFRCPSGLFACSPANTPLRIEPEPLPEQDWPVRLCLPLSLRCDNVPNCPDGGSDERNCNSSYIPTQFEIVEGEQNRLRNWLSSYDLKVLRSVGRDQVVVLSAGGPNYTLLLIAICLAALVVLLLILLTLFVFIPLCRYRRQRSEQKLTNVKTAPYEIISSDSPVPC